MNNIKKPLTNLKRAREYSHKIIKWNYLRGKIWNEVKSQVREYYGVRNVGEIPEDKIEEANDKAIQIIDRLVANH